MLFSKEFLEKVTESIRFIDLSELEKMIDILVEVREKGRLFIIGSGGGAGHASHAVCDFRKICNIEAYAPYDNVSFLTAITNDMLYDYSITEWLRTSYFNVNDCLFVFSVGGGAGQISINIINALEMAERLKAKIIGIVGKEGGVTDQLADACIVIQTKDYITPITEGLQAVIWHLLVEHPKLKINKTTW